MIPERRPRPLVVRALIVLGGFALVGFGGLLLVLPGPGLLVIAAGLGLLSMEFTWAARLRVAVQRRLARVTPKKRSGRIAGLATILAIAAAATAAVAVWGMPGFWPL
ncbi:MAG TPA: PGPGW domain-containing protein [Gaiellaceae bacterium]|nr:PGPGW domain-containing protein [Gaiellaceae bacterium]